MPYKINDKVKYIINDGDYMVVATRDEPYQHIGGEINVEDGKDYVIVRTGTNDVESFIHVQEVVLEPLEG